MDRIPNLPASKTTSGSFSADRIPTLPASRITTGTLNADRVGVSLTQAAYDLLTPNDDTLYFIIGLTMAEQTIELLALRGITASGLKQLGASNGITARDRSRDCVGQTTRFIALMGVDGSRP